MKYDGKIRHSSVAPYIWQDENGSVWVRLDAEKGLIKQAAVVFGPKQAFMGGKEVKKARMFPYISTSVRDTFLAEMKMEDRRFAYYFQFIDQEGNRFVYGSMGPMKEGDPNFDAGCYFQLCWAFSSEALRVPAIAKKKGAVIQIFPDRFYVGDMIKPSMKDVNLKVGGKPAYNSFFGGDLKGIEEKISYLSNLGISTVYLCPIFKSSSNHRYDVEDYLHVDERLGGDSALTSLVNKIHSYGMKIMLDGVFNHCSSKNPLFLDVVEKGRKSPYWGYFLINGSKPDPEKGNYERFASVNRMPKLDTSNPEVIKTCVGFCADVTRRFNIDGWRFDVADEISHDFWRAMNKALKAIDPNMLLIAEDWLPSENYLGCDQLDGTMNYLLRKVILSCVASEAPFKAMTIADKLSDLLLRYPWPTNLSMFNLVSSHDVPRLYTLTGCDRDKTLLGTAIAVCFPGMFMSYYGDERKMEGGADPDNRRPIDWNVKNLDQGYFDSYKDLLKLKRLSPCVDGNCRIYAEKDLLYIVRATKDQTLTLICNLSDKPQHKTLPQKRTEVCSNRFDGKWKIGPWGYVAYTLSLSGK